MAKMRLTTSAAVSYTHLDVYKRQELALCLQHQTGRDFTTSDGGHQLFQLRNLPDISTLINQTAHMNRKPATIHIIGLFTKQVE